MVEAPVRAHAYDSIGQMVGFERLADGILVRKEVADEFLIHHGCRRLVQRIVFIDSAALQDLDAHGLEKTASHVESPRVVVEGLDLRLGVDRHRAARAAAGEADRLDPGNGAQMLLELRKQRSHAFRRITQARRVEREQHNALRLKPQLHVPETREGLHAQPGAGQQQYRQSDLKHY